MGKRKITCNNSSCKHHTNGGCDTCITLNGSGKCKSFEKGFAYYFHIVWDALDNKNFIDMVEIRMNPDLKTGLFYVMECYDLGFSEMEWGTCRMVMLKDGKEGKPLKYEEIIEREINMEKFSKHLENFNNGIMPQMQQEQDAAGQQDKEEKEFGWLSPTGVFTESPFGTHEESAEQICEEKGFTEEYWNWVKEKAMQNVTALFGEAAAPEKRCSEGIVNILKAAVEEIYTGGLAKVTLNLRGGVKASISQNSKGEINVERTETKKQKLTE